VTQAPATGAFTMDVTNPGGGEQGRDLCEACTADVQCGGPNDNCLRIGSTSESFCFRACQTDTDCVDAAHPSGYYCSFTEMLSVDGASARQCLPESFSCGPPACQNDAYEPNGSLAAVASAAPLPAGSYPGLTMCPGDEDWYPLQIDGDSQVTVSLNGGSATDLDLALLDATGVIVAKSVGLTSVERIATCLSAGRYYLRVYSYTSGENSYALTWSKVAQSCQVCEDDWWEPDDNAAQARPVNLTAGRYYSDTNAICPGNDDWYAVTLQANQTLYATLAFTQTNAREDLDLRFYRAGSGGAVIDLIPDCTEIDPTGCSSTNGQSSTSNENFTWTATTAGTYYVVVHGYDGSANLYDICIALSNAAGTGCPPFAK
jgi:hypothetical protein